MNSPNDQSGEVLDMIAAPAWAAEPDGSIAFVNWHCSIFMSEK